MAALLYIPNFGLRSHPTFEFWFSTSHTDERNLFWLTITTTQSLGVTMFELPSSKSIYSGKSRVRLDVLYKQHKKKHHSGCTASSKTNLRLTHFCGIYSIMVWCTTHPKMFKLPVYAALHMHHLKQHIFYASRRLRQSINNGAVSIITKDLGGSNYSVQRRWAY